MTDDQNLPAQWAKEDTTHLDQPDAAVATLDEPFLIYNDRRQAISKLNKRMVIAGGLMLCYCGLLVSMGTWHAAAVLLTFWIVMYLWVVRSFNKAVTPLITLDSEGVKIRSLITKCDVTWDNLGAVTPYSFMYRFVGINPKSIWRVKCSLPQKLFLYTNAWGRLIYGLIGIRLFAISVPEQYSHFKAEEICEEIEKRRRHFAALPMHSAGQLRDGGEPKKITNSND